MIAISSLLLQLQQGRKGQHGAGIAIKKSMVAEVGQNGEQFMEARLEEKGKANAAVFSMSHLTIALSTSIPSLSCAGIGIYRCDQIFSDRPLGGSTVQTRSRNPPYLLLWLS